MLNNLILRLDDENIAIHLRQGNNLVFRIGRDNYTTFEAHDCEIADFICHLDNPGLTESLIKSQLSKMKDVVIEQRASLFLKQLINNNFIRYELKIDSTNKVVLCPYNPLVEMSSTLLNIEKKYSLSRFSYIRKQVENFALFNPISEFYILINGGLFLNWLFSITDKNVKIDELLKINIEHSKYIEIFINILLNGSFIHEENYEEPEFLKTWEFHDLLFHHSSRLGRSFDKYSFGATFRFKDAAFEFSFANQGFDDSKKIKLSKPIINDLDDRQHEIFQLLDKRRSIREYGKKLITLQEIGEFFYRSVGVRHIIESKPYDLTLTPCPSAGAIQELGFYIVCNSAMDLSQGIYSYNIKEHVLYEISSNKGDVQQLIKIAQSGWHNPKSEPQILIILTSRFKKIAWKYEGMAYRNTLFNVGVVFQTMYLVATALKLAPCALGYGNSKLFSKATGLNFLEEGSVGEFALGTTD